MKLEPNNYWWAFLAGGCLLISCFTHSVSKLETLVTSKQSVEIRLDYVPFNTPTAQFIALQGESIRSIQYSPYQLTIKSMAEGQLRNKDLTGLLTRLNDRTVREAFQQKDFTGAGLSRGNQVVLSVTTPDGVVQECYGFEAEMPETLRRWIEDVKKLAYGLQAAPLQDAYLRGQLIPEDQLRAIRQAGKLRLFNFAELPSAFQPTLSAAFAQPRLFHAINLAQYNQLLALNSSSAELFIVKDGSALRIRLFRGRE